MSTRATSTAEKPRHRPWAALTLALVLLSGMAFAVRCHRVAATAEPVPVKRETPVARLAVLNQSGCAWRIVMVPATGGETRIWRVAEAASLDVGLPEGDYMVAQTMLAETAGPEARRNFPMRLEAGQTYRWRLATLLSAESAETSAAAPAHGHE